MSATKIKSDEARRLAEQIASRAFKHINDPFYKAEKELAAEAYDMFYDMISDKADKMVELGFARRVKTVVIDVNDGVTTDTLTLRHEQPEDNIERDDDDDDDAPGMLIFPQGWNSNITLADSDLYERIQEMNNKWKPYKEQERALVKSLREQIEGKSANALKKVWPEATQLINEHFNLLGPVPCTQPLEKLLGKFLLALPAPVV